MSGDIDIRHPFGKEEDMAEKQLFTFFCNSLFLGQWQLAKACVKGLNGNNKKVEVSVKNVLRSLSKCPYDVSLGSDFVKTPHHLSWMCYKEWQKLGLSSEVKDQDLQRDIEFRLLLVEACDLGSESLIQDLYRYHKTWLGKVNKSAKLSSQETLSEDMIQFLSCILEERATLGYNILEAITFTDNPKAATNNETLQEIYLKVLNKLLDEIEKHSKGDRDPGAINKTIRTFCDILSFFNPKIQMKRLCSKLSNLFCHICKVLHENEWMTVDMIYTTLLGRESTYLIELFCDIHFEFELNKHKEADSKDTPHDLPNLESSILSLSDYSDRQQAWKHLYIICLRKQKHFLDVIMETAISLVKAKEFPRLQVLLQPTELKPLRFLVLLKGWDHCTDISSSRQLLEVFRDDIMTSEGDIFGEACKKLSSQLDMVQWCLDKTRLLQETVTNQQAWCHKKAFKMFHSFEVHSVLYMLHACTKLSALKQADVFELLQRDPFKNEDDQEQSGKKTVRFTIEDDHKEKKCDIQHEIDQSVYRSYCLMKLVMDALVFCADKSNWNVLNPPKGRRKAHSVPGVRGNASNSPSRLGRRSMSTIESPMGSSVFEHFQTNYDEQVMKKLETCRNLLSQLYPFTYRVEILENIFSLLFVTNEDVQDALQPGMSDSDIGAVEEILQSTSGDNLTSVDSSPIKPSFLTGEDIEANIDKAKRQLSFNRIQDFGLNPKKSQNTESEKIETDLGMEEVNDDSDGFIKEITKSRPMFIRNASLSGVSIKKMERQNSPSEPERRRRQSENLSTASNVSTSSNLKIGFLANEFVVRDLLATLRNALGDLDDAISECQGTGRRGSHTSEIEANPGLERHISHYLLSSVEEKTLKQRTNRLSQYISEARWRFQLVCHDWLSQEVGKIGPDGGMKVYESSSDVEFDSEEESPRSSKKRRRKTISLGRESSQSTGESESHFTNGTDGSIVSLKSKRKRKKSVQQRKKMLHLIKTKQGIICRMLATNESLLNMCLRYGKYDQAEQVVKMFELEGLPIATEVEFAQQYGVSMKQLHDTESRHKLLSSSSSISAAKSKASPSTKKSRISTVASVAAAGVTMATATSVVDQVLSMHSLPVFSQEVVHEIRQSASPLSPYIPLAGTTGMIVLDLACAGCASWDSSVTILGMAKMRLPEKKTRDSSMKEPTKKLGIAGIHKFLDQMLTLINLGAKEGASPAQLTHFKQGLNDFLVTAVLPLNANDMKQFTSMILGLESNLKKCDRAIVNLTKSDSKLWMLDSTKEADRQTKVLPSSQSTPAVRITMKSLILAFAKFVPREGVASYLMRGFQQPVASTLNYLESLYDHVKSLANLVAECEDMEEKDKQAMDYFTMLNEGPTEIFGKLMFDCSVEPERLEPPAKAMFVDLMQIIINSCCPKIPSFVPDKELPDIEMQYGRLILNSVKNNTRLEESHPEKVVRELLSKICAMMRSTSAQEGNPDVFSLDSLKFLSKSPEFQSLLASTHVLKEVDLQYLQSYKEKVAFFGNLTNLMFLHSFAYLVRSQQKKFQGILQRQNSRMSATTLTSLSEAWLHECLPVSCQEKLLFMNKMCYEVGQLGLISLYELRYMVLRHGLLPPCALHGHVKARHTELVPSDPWVKYGPPHERLLSYVISDCTVSSPPLKVLDPEVVREQLDTQVHDFMMASVIANTETATVFIPELINHYYHDFTGKDEIESSGKDVLKFVTSQVSGTLETVLVDLMEKEADTKLVLYPEDSQFLITFSHNQIGEHAQEQSKLRQAGSENSAIDIPSHSHERQHKLKEDQCKFQLTQDTLRHLRSKSSLVATLVSLVSSDDGEDVQRQMVDEHFPTITPTVEKDGWSPFDSPSGSLDIRSYRYQKLNEHFPELRRHLLLQSVPIFGALNPDIHQHSDSILKMSSSTLTDSTRVSVLSSPRSAQYESVVCSVLNELLNASDWKGMVTLLNHLPSVIFSNNSDWIVFKDFVLCCAVKAVIGVECKPDTYSTSSSHLQTSDALKYVSQISNPDTKARLVLGIRQELTVDMCVELLKLCDTDVSGLLKKSVTLALKRMTVYQRVIDHAKDLYNKSTARAGMFDLNKDLHDPEDVDFYDSLSTWKGVQEESKMNPKKVLGVLLRMNEFEIAEQWAEIHGVPRSLSQEIDERYVTCLLDSNPPDFIKAFQMLEKLLLKNEDGCLSICQNLIGNLINKRNTLFVTRFVLQYMRDKLTTKEADDLYLLAMGCKALLQLPDKERIDYEHLSFRPWLILEQLLMNMKIDLAGKVIASIKEDMDFSIKHGIKPVGRNLKTSDDLLVTYATKALEFSVVQPVSSPGTMSRSASRASMFSMASNLKTFGGATFKPSSPVLEGHESPRRRGRLVHSESANILMAKGGSSPRTVKSSNRTGSLPRKLSLSTPKQGGEISYSPGGTFVMPKEPPPREDWIPDEVAIECMVCKAERFSMFNRRHHCRRCGRVVCANCSLKTLHIRGAAKRSCDDCYKQTHRTKTPAGMLEDRKLRELREGNEDDSPYSSGHFTIGSTSPQINSPMRDDISDDLQGEYQYVLDLDEEINQMTREDFYYDHAPSSSLCLSMLNLHSNLRECGHVILALCDDISKLLQPLAPGVKNPEVDYTLVIGMMKYLLFNAKVKFTNASDMTGVGLCDGYLSKIDLLKRLVAANCNYIPSIQQLTKIDSLRHLRDKLIEGERLSLAMDVSTKCGIDPMGVWAAWGMACLHSSDYASAREKFSRCLKAPVDRHQIQQPAKLLNDIVEHLERTQPNSTQTVSSILRSLKSPKDLLLEPSLSPSKHMMDSYHEDFHLHECLYYLNAYGTYVNHVNFYRRHKQYGKALQFIVDKQCSSDVFIHGLVLPCLERGELSRLQDQLRSTDPSLQKWASFITAACKHFNKYRMFHVLYMFQIFMKDYIRAAMTCIQHFYQGSALSYVDLFERVHHLLHAKHHLETYIGDRQWGSEGGNYTSHGRGWQGSGRSEEAPTKMIMTPGDVAKYISTINQQIEVTKYLYRYIDNLEPLLSIMPPGGAAEGASVKNPRQKKELPTLFGSTRMKGDIVTLIILCGNNVHDGFGLAFRIIQDFKLDSTSVYVKTAQYLAREHKYASIKQLLTCIKESGLCTDQSYDEVISSSVDMIAEQGTEGKEAETLIKMMRHDIPKINAYILCGKLKSAYLIAVKAEREEDIKRIALTAEKLGQPAVKTICDKWLKQRQQRR